MGNRTSVDDGSVTSYTLDDTNDLNQYLCVGGTTYKYDYNGNLIDDGAYLYYYDCQNRLIDVNDQGDNRVVSYTYNFTGMRDSKTTYGSPDVTTTYCYD